MEQLPQYGPSNIMTNEDNGRSWEIQLLINHKPPSNHLTKHHKQSLIIVINHQFNHHQLINHPFNHKQLVVYQMPGVINCGIASRSDSVTRPWQTPAYRACPRAQSLQCTREPRACKSLSGSHGDQLSWS